MGFGHTRIRLGQFDDQSKYRRLIGLRSERLVKLQECVAERGAVGGGLGQDVLEFGLQLVASAGLRQRGHHLLRTLCGRVERLPELRGFERQRPLPREQRHFGRAPREPRLLRLARCFEVRARGERRVAALERNVAHQDPV